MVRSMIIIPARYASTRFPGKPLVPLNGKPMLAHVIDKARASAPDVPVLVATDDDRIKNFAQSYGVEVVMTPAALPSGTDRVLYALNTLTDKPDIVLNLQGDAPLVPAAAIKGVLDALAAPEVMVATPCKQLTWAELDALREAKVTTPFSGTTVIVGANNDALWFSKNIIPAIRKENRTEPLSPVFQHLGVYGYKRAALERYAALPESPYERLEGLEQLRCLENGMAIRCVPLPADAIIHGGIDTPEDLQRAESSLSWTHG